jgi:hypothetical protein
MVSLEFDRQVINHPANWDEERRIPADWMDPTYFQHSSNCLRLAVELRHDFRS